MPVIFCDISLTARHILRRSLCEKFALQSCSLTLMEQNPSLALLYIRHHIEILCKPRCVCSRRLLYLPLGMPLRPQTPIWNPVCPDVHLINISISSESAASALALCNGQYSNRKQHYLVIFHDMTLILIFSDLHTQLICYLTIYQTKLLQTNLSLSKTLLAIRLINTHD